MGNEFLCIARETWPLWSNESARYVCALTRLAYKNAFHKETQITQYPVGAGLPAKASSQPTMMLTDTPLSLASQLLQGDRAHAGK